MKSIQSWTFLLSLCGLLGGVCAQQETASRQVVPPLPPLPDASKEQAEQAVSLGVQVIKPGVALYAQLPSLPKGSGFLLKAVIPDGAASVAGLKPMDLIWKLDGQILINESQMLVLLAMHRPGDKVELSYFRSGEARSSTLTLQARSDQETPQPDLLAMPVAPPMLPMRVISYEDRSASISDKTGTATLTYREGKLWLRVESDQGIETFNNYVESSKQMAEVPMVWRSRLPVLQRSLEESIRMRRLPRVRHVPRSRTKARVAGGE
ncbi:PDZ domain-containing protein [Verrucomicrobiaceae bacterium N1E253]|uniref:PDZ domain-containing protein n=1 Tax=Oceaniferula marina TaxID=2748318 RepID=A0A851G8S3_9BACT|nr:PDZ domain-containing protein [Oceaniferula marina]NWK54013.1 PDZ domain-containing protein [Oceaniferula marina]